MLRSHLAAELLQQMALLERSSNGKLQENVSIAIFVFYNFPLEFFSLSTLFLVLLMKQWLNEDISLAWKRSIVEENRFIWCAWYLELKNESSKFLVGASSNMLVQFIFPYSLSISDADGGVEAEELVDNLAKVFIFPSSFFCSRSLIEAFFFFQAGMWQLYSSVRSKATPTAFSWASGKHSKPPLIRESG